MNSIQQYIQNSTNTNEKFDAIVKAKIDMPWIIGSGKRTYVFSDPDETLSLQIKNLTNTSAQINGKTWYIPNHAFFNLFRTHSINILQSCDSRDHRTYLVSESNGSFSFIAALMIDFKLIIPTLDDHKKECEFWKARLNSASGSLEFVKRVKLVDSNGKLTSAAALIKMLFFKKSIELLSNSDLSHLELEKQSNIINKLEQYFEIKATPDSTIGFFAEYCSFWFLILDSNSPFYDMFWIVRKNLSTSSIDLNTFTNTSLYEWLCNVNSKLRSQTIQQNVEKITVAYTESFIIDLLVLAKNSSIDNLVQCDYKISSIVDSVQKDIDNNAICDIGQKTSESIIYKENGKHYCFTENEIRDIIKQNSPLNPFTKNKLDLGFIQKMKTLFQKNISSDKDISHKSKNVQTCEVCHQNAPDITKIGHLSFDQGRVNELVSYYCSQSCADIEEMSIDSQPAPFSPSVNGNPSSNSPLDKPINTKANAKSNTKANAKSNAQPNAKTNAKTSAKTNAFTNAFTNARTNSTTQQININSDQAELLFAKLQKSIDKFDKLQIGLYNKINNIDDKIVRKMTQLEQNNLNQIKTLNTAASNVSASLSTNASHQKEFYQKLKAKHDEESEQINSQIQKIQKLLVENSKQTDSAAIEGKLDVIHKELKYSILELNENKKNSLRLIEIANQLDKNLNQFSLLSKSDFNKLAKMLENKGETLIKTVFKTQTDFMDKFLKIKQQEITKKDLDRFFNEYSKTNSKLEQIHSSILQKCVNNNNASLLTAIDNKILNPLQSTVQSNQQIIKLLTPQFIENMRIDKLEILKRIDMIQSSVNSVNTSITENESRMISRQSSQNKHDLSTINALNQIKQMIEALYKDQLQLREMIKQSDKFDYDENVKNQIVQQSIQQLVNDHINKIDDTLSLFNNQLNVNANLFLKNLRSELLTKLIVDTNTTTSTSTNANVNTLTDNSSSSSSIKMIEHQVIPVLEQSLVKVNHLIADNLNSNNTKTKNKDNTNTIQNEVDVKVKPNENKETHVEDVVTVNLDNKTIPQIQNDTNQSQKDHRLLLEYHPDDLKVLDKEKQILQADIQVLDTLSKNIANISDEQTGIIIPELILDNQLNLEKKRIIDSSNDLADIAQSIKSDLTGQIPLKSISKNLNTNTLNDKLTEMKEHNESILQDLDKTLPLIEYETNANQTVKEKDQEIYNKNTKFENPFISPSLRKIWNTVDLNKPAQNLSQEQNHVKPLIQSAESGDQSIESNDKFNSDNLSNSNVLDEKIDLRQEPQQNYIEIKPENIRHDKTRENLARQVTVNEDGNNIELTKKHYTFSKWLGSDQQVDLGRLSQENESTRAFHEKAVKNYKDRLHLKNGERFPWHVYYDQFLTNNEKDDRTDIESLVTFLCKSLLVIARFIVRSPTILRLTDSITFDAFKKESGPEIAQKVFDLLHVQFSEFETDSQELLTQFLSSHSVRLTQNNDTVEFMRIDKLCKWVLNQQISSNSRKFEIHKIVQTLKNLICERFENFDESRMLIQQYADKVKAIHNNRNNKILTYIKVRNDSSNDNLFNDRMNLRLFENNQILALSYNDIQMPLYDNKFVSLFESQSISTNKNILIPKYQMTIDYKTKRLTINHPNGPLFYEKVSIENDPNVQIEDGVVKSVKLEYNNNFILGPFTKVFKPQDSIKDIVNESRDQIVQSLISNKSVCLIAYGSSGSGKTSTFIESSYIDSKNKKISQPGIAIEYCNLMKSHFEKIQVEIKEYLCEETQDDTHDNKSCVNSTSATFFQLQNNWIRESDEAEKTIESSLAKWLIWRLSEQNRSIKSTTNNMVSSRSHVVVYLKFIRNINIESQNRQQPHLIIADFAGVESEFLCDNETVINEFSKLNSSDYIRKAVDNFLLKYPTLLQDLCFVNNWKNSLSQWVNNIDQNSLLELPEIVKMLKLKSISLKNQQATIKVIKTSKLTSNDEMDAIRNSFNHIRNKPNVQTMLKTLMFLQGNIKNGNLKISLIPPTQSQSFGTTRTISNEKLNKKQAQLDPISNNNTWLAYSPNDHQFDKSEIYWSNPNYRWVYSLIRKLNGQADGFDKNTSFGRVHDDIFAKYFSNLSIFLLKQLWTEHYRMTIQQECSTRVVEGKFINSSLKSITNFLTKAASQHTEIPSFTDACLPQQCNPYYNECFGNETDTNKMSDVSVHSDQHITKIITDMNSILGEEDFKNILFCVFNVINMSSNVNNPPPLPFIDLTDLILELQRLDSLNQKSNGLANDDNGLSNLFVKDDIVNTSSDAKINSNLLENWWKRTTRLRECYDQGWNSKINEFYEQLSSNRGDHPLNLDGLINYISISNATTTIGTMTFIEQMAKLGKNSPTCNFQINNSKQEEIEQLVQSDILKKPLVDNYRVWLNHLLTNQQRPSLI